MASESKYGGDSFGGDPRTSKISCVGIDVWQRGSVGDAARSGTARAAESHAIPRKCRKLTRTWHRGAVKRFFVDLALPFFQDNPVSAACELQVARVEGCPGAGRLPSKLLVPRVLVASVGYDAGPRFSYLWALCRRLVSAEHQDEEQTTYGWLSKLWSPFGSPRY